MYAIGQVVFSRQGRDKNLAFIVIRSETGFVWLVDGRIRPYAKPKRKKIKHIQPTYHIDSELAEKIITNAHLDDAEFKKALKSFEK